MDSDAEICLGSQNTQANDDLISGALYHIFFS